MTATTEVIDEGAIHSALSQASGDPAAVREVLAKARNLEGLTTEEAAVLIAATGRDALSEIFESARSVKETIYGSRLVLFAPLYISNYCSNECSYCAFRVKNPDVRRRALTQAEIARETEALVNQGHKRVLLVS